MLVALTRNIGLDHFIGHIATAAAEIPPRPHMPSPERFPQVGKLRQKLVRRLPLQPLDQSTYRNLRRNRYHQVHVILGNMPFQNLDLLRPTGLADQIPHPNPNLAGQHRTAILGNPDQVKVNTEYAVRAMPVFRHVRSLTQKTLKLSPKGEGFNPPKWGQ